MMHFGQAAQPLFAFTCKAYDDLAPIDNAGRARDQPRAFAARHQGHDAMMLRLQPFGQFAYGRTLPAGISLEMQQQLLLQRGQSLAFGRIFTKAQEAAQLITKFGQGLEIALAKSFFGF